MNKNTNMTAISAKYRAEEQVKNVEKLKRRGLSTNREKQTTSYEAQFEHYIEYIKKMADYRAGRGRDGKVDLLGIVGRGESCTNHKKYEGK